MAPEDVATVQRQVVRKLQEGVPSTDYQVDVFTPDGRRRTVEISSVRIPGGDRYHAILGIVFPGEARAGSDASTNLTSRQMEILHMLGRGASTSEIAAKLHLSKATVRNHIRNLFRVLGVHSRLGAVAHARREGILRDR